MLENEELVVEIPHYSANSLNTGSSCCVKAAKSKNKCKYCGKQFHYASILKRHVHSHLGMGHHKCLECEAAFITAFELQKHTQQSHHVSWFACSYCQRKFGSSVRLSRHLIIHTVDGKYGECGTAVAQLAYEKTRTTDQEKGRQENKFDSNTAGRSRLSHSSIESLARDSRLFDGCIELRAVSKANSQRRVCGYCGKQFPYPKDLKRHLPMHTGEKPHQCKQCGKGFGRPDKLAAHIKTHNGLKTSGRVRCQGDGNRLAREQLECTSRCQRLYEAQEAEKSAMKYNPDLFNTNSCAIKSAVAQMNNVRPPVKYTVNSLQTDSTSVALVAGKEPFASLSAGSSQLCNVDCRSLQTVSSDIPRLCVNYDTTNIPGAFLNTTIITNCSDSCSVSLPDPQRCDTVNGFFVEPFNCSSNSSTAYSSCLSNVVSNMGSCSNEMLPEVDGHVANEHCYVGSGLTSPCVAVQPATNSLISTAVCSAVNVIGVSDISSQTLDTSRLEQPFFACTSLNECDYVPLQPVVTSQSSKATVAISTNLTSNVVCAVSSQDSGSSLNSSLSQTKSSLSFEDRKCTYCGKQFQYMKDLKRHLPVHTGVKPYKCEECGKCFGRPDKLGAHIKLHTKPKKRKSGYKSRADVEKAGEDSASEKDKPLTDLYDANGRVNTEMFAAVEKTASAVTDGKPHMCSYCGKQFTRENNLTAHIRTHTGERPYVCFYCSKAFTRSERLKLHLRTHTGEKPYECQMCFKLFSRLHNLNRHSLTHLTKQQRESLQRKDGKYDRTHIYI
jgi:uncharacterized Zn-finger protein